MSIDLKDKRVVITGGSQGLGFAIAAALLGDGADVMLVGRNADKLADAAQRLGAAGGRVIHHAADICDANRASEIIERAVAEFGGLDVLINNAGVFVWKKALDLAAEDFDRTISTNLAAPFFLSQAAARAMVGQGRGGSIINISSIHGKTPDANVVAHCASKHGLIGLSKSLANALREHDIRVNAVCPGAIEANSPDRYAGGPNEKTTQGDIARIVSYLSSDMSRSVTGAAIDVHGNTHTVIQA